MNRNQILHKQAELDETLDPRLTRALETPPRIAVPRDFALRVAARAQAVGQRSAVYGEAAPPSIGARVAWVASAALLVAVVAVLAPSSATLPARHWIALGLEVEFAALTAWLSLRTIRQQG